MRNLYDYEIAIIGGSNAGLAAALTLGRSCRNTIVFDAGKPRNQKALHAHNFYTRDGALPSSLIEAGKEQLQQYNSVVLKALQVTSAKCTGNGFEIVAENKEVFTVKKIILATGVSDVLPDIKGLKELWGTKIINCPYCHGWEVKDKPIAIIADGEVAYEMAPILSNLNKDIVFLLNGTTMDTEKELVLANRGWEIVKTSISAITDAGDCIRITLSDGTEITRVAAYAKPSRVEFNNQLATQLGCELHESTYVKTDSTFQTSIDGIYAVGDLVHPGFHQVSLAAAAGHKAAAFCNNQMCNEDFFKTTS